MSQTLTGAVVPIGAARVAAAGRLTAPTTTDAAPKPHVVLPDLHDQELRKFALTQAVSSDRQDTLSSFGERTPAAVVRTAQAFHAFLIGAAA
jgi:hypothetical protein